MLSQNELEIMTEYFTITMAFIQLVSTTLAFGHLFKEKEIISLHITLKAETIELKVT